MKKISTVFKKDPNDLSRVINEVNPENQWVLEGEGIATRKFDGTACAIIMAHLFKRYDVKKGRSVPDGAIPCQEPDEITGHWPHWVPIHFFNPEDKYFTEAWEGSPLAQDAALKIIGDGTYELCGPKINGNKEKFDNHVLIRHGSEVINDLFGRDFNTLRNYLSDQSKDIEGIVFHHPDGRMAKIRKSDFGFRR